MLGNSSITKALGNRPNVSAKVPHSALRFGGDWKGVAVAQRGYTWESQAVLAMIVACGLSA